MAMIAASLRVSPMTSFRLAPHRCEDQFNTRVARNPASRCRPLQAQRDSTEHFAEYGNVDLTHSRRRRGTAAICAFLPAGVDVELPFRIVTADVDFQRPFP